MKAPRVVFLHPEDVSNILRRVPADAADGEAVLLVGDPDVKGMGHCALVIVGALRPTGSPILVGAQRHEVKVGPDVDAWGFMLGDLTRRVVRLERLAGVAGVERIDPPCPSATCGKAS